MGRSVEIIKLADAPQGVCDALLFGLELLSVTDMLPGTSAAIADVGARRSLAQRRRRDDVYNRTDGVALFGLNEPGDHPIAGSAVGNHDRFAVAAADAVGAVGKPVDI